MNVIINPPAHKTASIQKQTTTRVQTDGVKIVLPREEYTGATTFTPSDTAQVIATQDRVLNSNITINPIPSNYGKIAWNGATLSIT